jgi:hypothetical protein
VSEVLESCRALMRAADFKKDWSEEKKAAYESNPVVDESMLDKVAAANKENFIEIDGNHQKKGIAGWLAMRDAFTAELEREWPVEYGELHTAQDGAKETAELMQRCVTIAYQAGYMLSKRWVSSEGLSNANLYSGSVLVTRLKSTLKECNSKAIAFGESLMKISRIGEADASPDAQLDGIASGKKPSRGADFIVSCSLVEAMSVVSSHHDVVNRHWQVVRGTTGVKMLDVFLIELEKRWPIEYSELTKHQAGETDMDALLDGDSGTFAWSFGYACERGWLSQDNLRGANMALGDALAAAVRNNRKQGRSTGVALAAALGRISELGAIDARTLPR